jgi:hypothetical protein
MRFVYIPRSMYYLRFSGLSLHDRQKGMVMIGSSKRNGPLPSYLLPGICAFARQNHVTTTCDLRLVGLGVFALPCSGCCWRRSGE